MIDKFKIIKMKYTLIFIFLLSIINLFGQRKANEVDSLVSAWEIERSHFHVDSVNNDKLRNYCKSILGAHDGIAIDSIERIALTSFNDTFVEINSNEFRIFISSETFDSTKHKIDRIPHTNYIYLVDGKPFYGLDGGISNYRIGLINVFYQGKKVIVPKEEFNDLFAPNYGCVDARDYYGNSKYCYNYFYKCKYSNYYFLLMSNSDAAGSYKVIWIFKGDKYIMRVIDGV